MKIKEDILNLGNQVIIKLELEYHNPKMDYVMLQKMEFKQKLISMILGNDFIVDSLLKKKEIVLKIS